MTPLSPAELDDYRALRAQIYDALIEVPHPRELSTVIPAEDLERFRSLAQRATSPDTPTPFLNAMIAAIITH